MNMAQIDIYYTSIIACLQANVTHDPIVVQEICLDNRTRNVSFSSESHPSIYTLDDLFPNTSYKVEIILSSLVCNQTIFYGSGIFKTVDLGMCLYFC